MTLTSDFDFHLPPDRIAQHPARPLVIGDILQDHRVRDLPDLLRPGDLTTLASSPPSPPPGLLLAVTRQAARWSDGRGLVDEWMHICHYER